MNNKLVIIILIKSKSFKNRWSANSKAIQSGYSNTETESIKVKQKIIKEMAMVSSSPMIIWLLLVSGRMMLCRVEHLSLSILNIMGLAISIVGKFKAISYLGIRAEHCSRSTIWAGLLTKCCYWTTKPKNTRP